MTDKLEQCRKAGLPDLVAKATLPSLGQNALRAIVQNREFQKDGSKTSYVLVGQQLSRLARVSAVFGKELLAVNEKVQYSPAITLSMAVDIATRTGESETMDTIYGARPWIIVPDLSSQSWADGRRQESELYATLRSIYFRGIPLVITREYTKPSFNEPFFDQLVETFTEIDIG